MSFCSTGTGIQLNGRQKKSHPMFVSGVGWPCCSLLCPLFSLHQAPGSRPDCCGDLPVPDRAGRGLSLPDPEVQRPDQALAPHSARCPRPNRRGKCVHLSVGVSAPRGQQRAELGAELGTEVQIERGPGSSLHRHAQHPYPQQPEDGNAPSGCQWMNRQTSVRPSHSGM